MNETIGKRIAELRKSKGFTQEDLADRLNVSGQAVSKWENDQTCPDIGLLPQLSRVLGVIADHRELCRRGSGKGQSSPSADQNGNGLRAGATPYLGKFGAGAG